MDNNIYNQLQPLNMHALLTTMVQLHPYPEVLKDLWLRNVSASFGTWSHGAIAAGLPGYGKKEMQKTMDEWTATFDSAIKAKKDGFSPDRMK
jgi:hypothetical protein